MAVDNIFDFPAPPAAGDFFGNASFAPTAATGDAGAVFSFDGVDPELRPVRIIFPNGTYDATIDVAQLDKSKKGFRQVKLKIMAYDANNRKNTVFTYLGLEGETPEKTAEKLAAFYRVVRNVAPSLVNALRAVRSEQDMERLCAELANRTCRVKLKSETYEGQVSNKVEFEGILPPSAGFNFQ